MSDTNEVKLENVESNLTTTDPAAGDQVQQARGQRNIRNKFDVNDEQNELDYEEEDEAVTNRTAGNNVGNAETNRRANINDEDDSDGEIKSEKGASDVDDGEVASPKAAPRKESEAAGGETEEKPEVSKEDEEDGEINDGEKLKKTFIPRKLCKYYQRGKCTWGRTCKFLHPGVNDTGNYSFLEYQDPTAKAFQAGQSRADGEGGGDASEPIKTETAWERGLRHAKEMKEKALRRKQMEKDQFEDKKMNLSLKEFENEDDNDERYMNVEKAPKVDDFDEDEMNFYAASSNRPRPNNDPYNNPYGQGAGNPNFRNNNPNRGFDYNQQQMGAAKTNRPPPSSNTRRSASPSRGGANNRADEWHDPWDRSRKSRRSPNRRDRSSNSYSSSDSDSRSRSRSYSSKSSSSSRSDSRSYSSRSRSRSPAARRKESIRSSTQGKSADKKKTESSRPAPTSKSSLPGRNISEVSLKKAEAGKNKSKRTRSRSNSSSSYTSSKSGAENDDDDIDNVSDSDNSDEDMDDDSGRKSSSKNKGKRTAKASGGDVKRQKSSPTAKAASSKTVTSAKPTDKEKEKKNQLIKEQLKLLENAINKKKAMAK